MDLRKQHIVVLGAGISGLASAVALVERGLRRVTVVEEEASPFFKASGLNAAIYRPLECDSIIATLAAQSRDELIRLQSNSQIPLLRRNGLLMLGHDVERLASMQTNAARNGMHADFIDRARAMDLVHGLHVSETQGALWSRDGGTLDPHAIGQALLRKLTSAGVDVRLKARVSRLLVRGARICNGIELGSGERLEADAVILCAGAASGPLSMGADAPLPLLPLRRHLAILESKALPIGAPVVWQQDPEIYFRPESGGVLVSPCDETPASGAVAQTDLEALAPLSDRFRTLYPALHEAKVRRVWACIRTKAPDNRPIIGPAPHLGGLFYLTGLGGFGMSCGLMCGRLIAESVIDGRQSEALSPQRLLLPSLQEDHLRASEERESSNHPAVHERPTS